MTSLLALIGFLSLLAPERALADYEFVNGIVNIVGGFLPPLPAGYSCDASGGGCGFVAIAANIVTRLQPLIYGMGALTITIFGFRMIVAQEDDIRDKARGVITAVVSGMMLTMLINPFIAAFYGTTGEIQRGAMNLGVMIANEQVTGIINWALVLAAPVALAQIIYSATNALIKSTSEEQIAEMRKTVIGVVVGLLLIILRFVIVDAIGADGTPSPVPVLRTIVDLTSFVLTFMALAAVVVIIYAGILMILNLGNDEQVTKAKGIIIRAFIGLIVILVSWALVRFVVGSAV